MNTRLLFPFCSLLFLNVPCSPILYTPPVQNVTLPAKKGDGNFTASFGESGINVQGGSAISKNNLFLVNVRIDSKKRSSAAYSTIQQSSLQHTQFSFELGLGKYGRFGRLKYGAWSIAGGYGQGRTTETPIVGNAFVASSAPYQRVFLQPAIGFTTNQYDFAFSCQGAWTQIGRIKSGSEMLDGRFLTPLTLEPAITFSLGGKHIRFFMQFSSTIGNSDYYEATGNQSDIKRAERHMSAGFRALLNNSNKQKE